MDNVRKPLLGGHQSESDDDDDFRDPLPFSMKKSSTQAAPIDPYEKPYRAPFNNDHMLENGLQQDMDDVPIRTRLGTDVEIPSKSTHTDTCSLRLGVTGFFFSFHLGERGGEYGMRNTVCALGHSDLRTF